MRQVKEEVCLYYMGFGIWPEGFMQIKRDAAPDAASIKHRALKSVKKAKW